jgi:hypothetical protein
LSEQILLEQILLEPMLSEEFLHETTNMNSDTYQNVTHH